MDTLPSLVADTSPHSDPHFLLVWISYQLRDDAIAFIYFLTIINDESQYHRTGLGRVIYYVFMMDPSITVPTSYKIKKNHILSFEFYVNVFES